MVYNWIYNILKSKTENMASVHIGLIKPSDFGRRFPFEACPHSFHLTSKVDLQWWILALLHCYSYPHCRNSEAFVVSLLSSTGFRSVLPSKTNSFPRSVCFSYHFASLRLVVTPPKTLASSSLVFSPSQYVKSTYAAQCNPVHALATVPSESICVLFCA